MIVPPIGRPGLSAGRILRGAHRATDAPPRDALIAERRRGAPGSSGRAPSSVLVERQLAGVGVGDAEEYVSAAEASTNELNASGSVREPV